MLKLELFGGLSLSGDQVPAAALQRRRLALLALLALAGRRGVSRERVQVHLWPDSSESRARHALDQLLYATRRDLGRDVVISGTSDLRLNPDRIEPDIWAFDDAVHDLRWLDAVDTYRGPVLHGFHLIDESDFEQWLDVERARCQQDYHRALESLARVATEEGAHDEAVRWWRQRAASEPLSASVTLELMRALVAIGDVAGALQHARAYEDAVQAELGVEADESVVAYASSLVKPATGNVVPDPPAIRRRSRRRVVAAVAVMVTLGVAIAVAASMETESATSPPDPTTHSLYLRARAAWNTRTENGLKEAVVLYRRATEHDPIYAPAYTGLAESYAMIGYFGFEPADAMFPKARAAASRALDLDTMQGGAYAALGQVLAWEHKWKEAEQVYKRGLGVSPTNPTVHQWYALLLAYLGRAQEAALHTGHARRLDPLSLQINNMHGMMLHHAGQLDAALRQYARTVEDEPDSAWVRQNPWVLSNYGAVAGDAGQYAKAIRLIERALAVVPTHPRPLIDLAGVYLAKGDTARAKEVFARADTMHEHYAMYRGLFEAELGDLDQAFAWLDRIQDWPLPSLVSLNNGHAYQQLRADPRFQSILQRVGQR